MSSKAKDALLKWNECTCGSKDEVTNCPSVNCPLWNHRPWQPKNTTNKENAC